MIDRIGHELEIGDVVVMPHKSGYVELQVGRVVGFTAKNVKVDVYHTVLYKQPPRMIQPMGLVCIRGEDALAYILAHG